MTPAELQLNSLAVGDYIRQLGHASLADYQKWYGLRDDGVIGPITSSLLAEPRCGVPDFAGAEKAQWPRSCMIVPVAYEFDRIDANIAAQAWKMALDKWTEVCGVVLELVDGLNNGKIWATDGPLPGSTLAWSFLANDRCNARLEQRYDTTISYTVEFLTKIIFHEVGHALGLGHSNRRSDIMWPSISGTPWSAYPSQNDINRVVQRYGEPEPIPEPPTTPEKPKVLFTTPPAREGQTFSLVTGKTTNGGVIEI